MPWRARLREQRGSDGGFTLVEILIAMMLLLIVIGLTTKTLIGAIDQQSGITQQTQAQNRNQVGMELATRLLRQAVYPCQGTYKTSNILGYADASKVVFTSGLSATAAASNNNTYDSCATNGAVQNYVLELDPTTPTNFVWGSAGQISCLAGSTCTYGTPSPTHTAIYGVRNAGGAATCSNNSTGAGVFRYFYLDTFGNEQEFTTFPLTSIQLGQVQYIEIDLYTQTQTGPQRPACDAYVDRVELRNWL